jgi:carbon-monoxide dehydrogenase large subunit
VDARRKAGHDERMDHPRTSNRPIGSPIERLEDLRFLRGRGQYVDDVPCPDALHAVILRSAVPHGRIRSIDASAALKQPGVRAVFTAADIGDVPIITMRQELLPELKPYQQPVIATDKVRYVGEPLAVVVADSVALAEDALEHIDADIEALPPVPDRAASQANRSTLFEETGRNHILTLRAEKGDAGAAFKDAPYTRRERFSVQRFTAMSMETRGLLAEWDAAKGHLTVSGMTKVVFHNRRILAKQMGLAEDAITMIEADVGGGFGVRGEFYPEDFLIPFAARRLNCPVRWVEDRHEHLIASNHARDSECELEIACARNGTILGLRGKGAADLGAYIRTNGITAPRNTAQVLAGPYRVANLDFEMELLLTNKTPSGTYRGPGRFEADFFRERLFDMAANDLGIDRVEFRRRNLVAEHEMPWPLPTVQPLDQGSATDSGDYRQTLERCLAEFGWAEKSKLQGQWIDGRRHGIAVGCYLEGGGSGPRENVRMVLEANGTVSLYVGSSSVGQGVETVFAQIAADALDMPMEHINRVQHGSTIYVKQGYGSYSSRSIVMGGSAIVQAAGNLKEAIRAAAAKRLQCDPGAVEVDGDNAIGPTRASVPLSDLAADGISSEGTYASRNRTYSYGAHAAHVAVDPRTGHVAVIDYMAVEDVGRIINPLTLHGQTVGAIVQGLGGVLLEHLVYDEDGQFLSGTLADYLLPTASDFPAIRAHAMEEKPAPENPLGAKGAGEGGIIPVGGVIGNAVANALGVEPRDLPLTPPRVWDLIQPARKGPSPGSS